MIKFTHLAKALFVSALILMIFSCKKKDETLPEIKLYKDSIDTIILNEKLIDPGATAMDNVDGDVSPQIESDYLTVINKDSAGVYIVHYKIVDKAGNVNTISRKVIVQNQAYIWEGNYNAIDTIINLATFDTLRKTYTMKLVASKFKNQMFYLESFGKYKTLTVPAINLTAYVADSLGNKSKANVPLSDKPYENLILVGATTCGTCSHKIRSYKPFYLYKTPAPKKILMIYEDEVYDPATCVSISRGFLSLTYVSSL